MTRASRRRIACAAFVCVLALPSFTPAAEAPWSTSSQPGLSLRVGKPSNGIIHVEIRNDLAENVWFNVTIWTSMTEKKTWNVAILSTGQVRDISLTASTVTKVEFSDFQTDSARSAASFKGKPEWKTADVVVQKGTRSIRFHFDDPIAFSDRKVRLNLTVVGRGVTVGGVNANLGWETFVVPDSDAKRSGKKNSVFYFGIGQLGGTPVADGDVWVVRREAGRGRIQRHRRQHHHRGAAAALREPDAEGIFQGGIRRALACVVRGRARRWLKRRLPAGRSLMRTRHRRLLEVVLCAAGILAGQGAVGGPRQHEGDRSGAER